VDNRVTLVVTDGDRGRAAYFMINGVQAQKVRFGDRRRCFIFFSIYNGERGPELTASSGGLLTSGQMAAYIQIRAAIQRVLDAGESCEIAALDSVGLEAVAVF